MSNILKKMDLNKVERELKYFYEAYPSRHLDSPCSHESIRDVIEVCYGKAIPDSAKYLVNNIDEHIFFSKDLDVAFVKHMRYTPAFWHEHDFFELVYVLKGHCTNIMFNQSLSMDSGDICIMAPGIEHAISAFSDDDIILNILIRKSTFEYSFLGLLDGDDILSDFFKRSFYQTREIPYLIFHTGNDELLHRYVNNAYQEYNGNHRYKNQMLNAILSEFFIILFRNHEHSIETPTVRMSSSEHNLMYILQYMQANYSTITLKELSEFFNYSERQLQRIILNATGMTFMENIQKQKIAKATDLLRNSNITIAQICENIGFNSLNNFRKIFFKHYSMTPSEYRRKYHEENVRC